MFAEFYKQRLVKPDGRYIVLYGMKELSPEIDISMTKSSDFVPNPHLRWHPFRGEWVAYASYRQQRAFLPPKEYNPLAVTHSQEFPTELPPGNYDVAVFENLSPALSRYAQAAPELIVPSKPGFGACEVIVFSQNAETSLGKLPLRQIELLLSVWADRYAELSQRDDIKYVMPFENRGVEVGVTLHHPHGQLYAYPFIPPVALRKVTQEKTFFQETGRTLLGDHVEKELKDRTRLIYDGEKSLAFVPAFARYPYEVWVTSKRSVPSLCELASDERKDLAHALKTVLLKYDGLWQRAFPYLMAIHQAPTDGANYPESHFHIEFSPPYRMKDRLKYLAGTELGAGMFANDSIPEEKAAELKAVEVNIE